MSNLKWSSQVDWSNAKIRQKLEDVQKSQISMVIPSTVAQEKDINVFMRCDYAGLQETLGTSCPVQTMATLREMKNSGQVIKKG